MRTDTDGDEAPQSTTEDASHILAYGRARTPWARRVVRMALATILLLLICWLGAKAWPRVVAQWTMHQARGWHLAPSTVVLDETSASASLLKDKDYLSVPVPSGRSPFVVYHPAFWPRLLKLADSYDSRNYALAAACVRNAGKGDRLVCVVITASGGSGGLSDVIEFRPFAFPASIAFSATGIPRDYNATSGYGASLKRGARPRDLRVFAGYPDPHNPARIIIEYEEYGVRGVVYVDLITNDSVRVDGISLVI